jgi:amino acid transporter
VLGSVFGVLAFTGFEASSYLGEEAREPRRTIPRAILVTLVLVGLIYVFFFYVVTIGYGLGNMGKLASDPAPWDTLGRQYWNSGATVLVDIASVVALLAGGVAATNGSARMLLALGRDGLLPRALGRTSMRFRTPHVALTLMFVVSVAMGLGFGVGYSPLPAFTLLSLVVTLNALAVYALAQIAVVVYFRRNGGFNVIWHLVVPALAVAIIVYLYLKSVSPTPAYPSNVAIWLAIGWAALGLLAMLGLSKFAPSRLAEAATIIGEGDLESAGEVAT